MKRVNVKHEAVNVKHEAVKVKPSGHCETSM